MFQHVQNNMEDLKQAALPNLGLWGLQAGATLGKPVVPPCLLPVLPIYRITTLSMTSLVWEGCNAGLTARVLPFHEP